MTEIMSIIGLAVGLLTGSFGVVWAYDDFDRRNWGVAVLKCAGPTAIAASIMLWACWTYLR